MASHRDVHPDYEVTGYGPSLDSAYNNTAYDGTFLDANDTFIQRYEDPPHEVSYDGVGYAYNKADGYNGPFLDA